MNLNRQYKIEYVRMFIEKYKLDKHSIISICKLYKEPFSINGRYNAILKWQISALEEKEKEVKHG